ncbi:hypothetical protein [Pseudolabrys sp.]|uniref:hypothetical protein n=1 Tax=Pseudolabrys sp. TaxID=1960880 RepID=UPI003D0F0BCF
MSKQIPFVDVVDLVEHAKKKKEERVVFRIENGKIRNVKSPEYAPNINIWIERGHGGYSIFRNEPNGVASTHTAVFSVSVPDNYLLLQCAINDILARYPFE